MRQPFGKVVWIILRKRRRGSKADIEFNILLLDTHVIKVRPGNSG
jgi:hypothetical protein